VRRPPHRRRGHRIGHRPDHVLRVMQEPAACAAPTPGVRVEPDGKAHARPSFPSSLRRRAALFASWKTGSIALALFGRGRLRRVADACVFRRCGKAALEKATAENVDR
jgi:hypothetical protein